jgi:hypothetical protein
MDSTGTDSGRYMSTDKGRIIMPFILIASVGFVVMSGTIFYAAMFGNFLEEGRVLVEMPWGLVSLVDIYLGLILFSLWVLWREQLSTASLVWVVLIVCLGNVISCLYILNAYRESGSDMLKFWHGSRSGKM